MFVRIIKNYREQGKTKQKVIAHLGKVDLIKKGELTRLAKKLARFEGKGFITGAKMEELTHEKDVQNELFN